MTKQYRNNGATGALLDEYEKVLNELVGVIDELTNEELVAISDNNTEDPDCKSIQTILTHVIRAGYCYNIEIRKSLGEQVDFVEGELLNSVEQYQDGLKKMFNYNEQLFMDYPNLNLEEHNFEKKIHTRWGQHYDVEQLLEHAIVHILRHRRQIERFVLKLR